MTRNREGYLRFSARYAVNNFIKMQNRIKNNHNLHIVMIILSKKHSDVLIKLVNRKNICNKFNVLVMIISDIQNGKCIIR